MQLKNLILKIPRFLELIKDELDFKADVPIHKKLWAYRNGFLSKSVILYNLNEKNKKLYLNDFDRYIKTPLINGNFKYIVNNKLTFYKYFSAYKEFLPEHFYFLKNGTIIEIQDIQDKFASVDDIIVKLDACKNLVMKPFEGGGGKNIYFLKKDGEEFYLNKKIISVPELKELFARLNGYLVSEYAEQHEYSRQIFPDSANTIRVLTLWDVDTNTPLIARTVHRFGRNTSKLVDNLTQGGLAALVNTETGQLSQCASFDRTGRREHSHHPDTNQQINGIYVYNWELVKTKILEIAASIPYMPYLGWDIIITENSFKIIEANNYSCANLLQANVPLLNDERIIKFYKKYNVIK